MRAFWRILLVGIILASQHSIFALTQEQQIQRDQAKADAEEDEWMKAFSAGKQWTACPKWVRGIYIDPAGNPWFEAEAIDSMKKEDGWTRSLERVQSGKSRVFRWDIERVDRAGRVFLQDQGGLRWYDAKTKEWSVRLADGKDPSPDDLKLHPDHGRFDLRSWEDSTGADWFFGGGFHAGWYIQRFSADGKWDIWQMPAGSSPSDFPIRFPTLIEQNNGCFVMCAEDNPEDADPKTVVALRFDGKNWAAIDPRICKAPYHYTSHVIPNRDGSITTICTHGAIWTYWPEDALNQAAEKVRALIDSLSDPDPSVRDNAHQRLAFLGQKIVPLMKAALGSAPPAGQQGLTLLIKHAGDVDAKCTKDNHGNLAYGDQWEYDGVYLCSRNLRGHTALFVDTPVNVLSHRRYNLAIAIVQDDGSWEVHPCDQAQWEKAGWSNYPTDAYVDSKGRIWMDHAKRFIDADMKMHVVAPAGLEIDQIIGEDKGGRFYMRGNGTYVIYDEHAGEAVAQVEEKSFSGFGPYSVSGDTSAGAISSEHDSWVSVRGSTTQPANAAFKGGKIIEFIPLRSGGALIGGGDFLINESWILWDGVKSIAGPDAFETVKSNVNVVAKIAGRDFADFDNLQLAADDLGHVWFAHRFYRFDNPAKLDSQVHVDEFQYWDGSKWHDVYTDINRKVIPLRAINNGRIVLARSEQSLLAISYPNGKANASVISSGSEAFQPPTHFVDSPTGETWAYYKYHLLLIRDGEFESQEQDTVPLLVDADGRLWCVNDGKLLAKVSDGWIKATISGVDQNTQMIQTPDKRIWALHREALSLVNIDSSSGSPTIKEAGRWSWGSPRNNFPGLVCDGSSYLWYTGNENNCVRLTLPKAGG